MKRCNTRVAIVILNYLNDADTVECIESAFRLEATLAGIVVVDNASDNGALARLQERYQADGRIAILAAKANLGFARGNNLGICYARRELQADFVLVVNNDTVFTDPLYIEKLIHEYEPGIGMLGSAIQLPDGTIQNEYSGYFAPKRCFFEYMNILSASVGTCFDFPLDKTEGTTILHGSALLFTPDFFRYYNGFYPKTFLYHEEEILYLMCKCKKLRQKYVSSTKITHKEDRSSEMSFSNSNAVKQRYSYKSYKYVLLWAVKAKISKSKR